MRESTLPMGESGLAAEEEYKSMLCAGVRCRALRALRALLRARGGRGGRPPRPPPLLRLAYRMQFIVYPTWSSFTARFLNTRFFKCILAQHKLARHWRNIGAA